MAPQDGLDVCASTAAHGFEVRHRTASSHDGESLASMFDRIEQIGEVACRIGRGYLGHTIRLSDRGLG